MLEDLKLQPAPAAERSVVSCNVNACEIYEINTVYIYVVCWHLVLHAVGLHVSSLAYAARMQPDSGAASPQSSIPQPNGNLCCFAGTSSMRRALFVCLLVAGLAGGQLLISKAFPVSS